MKKSLRIVLPILIVLLVVGAFIIIYFTIFKTDSEIKSLEILEREIVLEVGDTKDLKDCFIVTPNEANIYVMCYINN